ncbi:MAG: hypothetical protein ABIG39_04560 [Candidatus Micrarchaeota archaeon]
MNVEDLLISTGVDNLIRLIHDAGRIELKDAAKNLGISSASVQEWSRVLEEEGLVRIDYQLTKIYLVWIGSSPKELAIKSERLKDRKAELVRDVETMLGRLDARGGELQKLEMEFKKMTELLDPKMGGVRRRLEALKEIEKEKDRLFDSHIAKMGRAKDDYRKLNEGLTVDEKRIKDMHGKVHEIKKSIESIEPELEALGPMKQKIFGLVENVSREAKEISETLSTHRDQLQNLNVISQELKQRRNSLSDMEERVSAIGAEIKQLIQALEIISKQAEQQKHIQKTLEDSKYKIADFERQRRVLEELHESVNRESKDMLRKAGGVLRIIDGMESKFKDIKKLEGSRVTPIDEYLKTISELKERTKADLKEVNSLDVKAMSDIAKAKAGLETRLSEMMGITKTFEGLSNKKRELDAICKKVEDMQNVRRRLFQQATLLSKEIELVNIQKRPAGSPKVDLKVDELTKKMEVVKRDQDEFDKRRLELRKMIEKMIGEKK